MYYEYILLIILAPVHISTEKKYNIKSTKKLTQQSNSLSSKKMSIKFYIKTVILCNSQSYIFFNIHILKWPLLTEQRSNFFVHMAKKINIRR